MININYVSFETVYSYTIATTAIDDTGCSSDNKDALIL